MTGGRCKKYSVRRRRLVARRVDRAQHSQRHTRTPKKGGKLHVRQKLGRHIASSGLCLRRIQGSTHGLDERTEETTSRTSEMETRAFYLVTARERKTLLYATAFKKEKPARGRRLRRFAWHLVLWERPDQESDCPHPANGVVCDQWDVTS